MLKKGIYENIINDQLDKDIMEAENNNLTCNLQNIDNAESPKMLADYIANILQKKLEDTEEQQDRINIVNNILSGVGLTEEYQITQSKSLLAEVISKEQAAIQAESQTSIIRPLSGFRVSNLFTGGNSKISIGEEIRREIASADEICFVVSFLKLSGLRIILDDLKNFCRQSNKKLRIITTTYCAVTEAKALLLLSQMPNTEIHISYNTDIERLHAKSYIFLRNSGLHTAYIGSSNLSKSAQTEGLEWNVRVTSVENPHIIKSALATFDMYWNSSNFEDFSIGGIDKFNRELKRNIIQLNSTDFKYQRYILLPHQKQILDQLRVEREENNNHKNLVVAATGTGKTVISAFDYLEFSRRHPNSKILFTAHREEILRQSLNTYRSVLGDNNFGALWVGGCRPQEASEYEHLFVSISMLNSRFDDFFAKLGADYYDYIVIDEAHHSQADSYRKMLNHFSPKIMLGLTATPERMDGRSLRPDFGGRISAEIRLPQALQAGLLTPFQYLCVTDNVDLSDDDLWNGQKYKIDKLDSVLCSAERVENIVSALHRYLADEYTCRALCFCVNKHHADYMASQLSKYGFNAHSLTSDTPTEQRKKLTKQLRNGEIHYLCVVDIFNEGVDIPEIDTVLFLRPTESLTIFLQQLGRGLRLSVGKTELTVLDFVAQANKKYEFANRFRALTLHPEKDIASQVKDGFTLLPSGCSIIMEKKARQYILDNIKNAIYNKNRLIREINSYALLPTITQFIENNGQDIRIIYQTNRCWTTLKRDANRIDFEDDAITKHLVKGMANLVHHNSIKYLHFVERFVNGSRDYEKKEYHSFALMLYYNLFQEKYTSLGFNNIYEALALVHNNRYKYFKQEISEIVDYLLVHLKIKTSELDSALFPNLDLYGCYTREEIFTLVGKQTETKVMQGSVSGVFNLTEQNAILLFVTLNKSDKDFSPSTQYNDYVINDYLFHWQSQNTDAHNNKGGARYLEQRKKQRKILLFVREEKKDGFGNTSPFHCFGFVNFVESHGDRPMNIKWKLEKPVMAQYLNVI